MAGAWLNLFRLQQRADCLSELDVAATTIKTHIRNLYQKLGVAHPAGRGTACPAVT
ncbi:LuxR C-terminal-related transcriptional regulator [Klebsiella pneumoniae]|nr:LuxR C-terminal-related transcriptional regulator [Klebsiella pneumoniae]